MNKVLLLELNEVPSRVMDFYCSRRPSSALSKVLDQCTQYQTICEDRFALDPWISWSTMHRGVTDEHHQILHLGEVLDRTDKEFPPLWRILGAAGLKVGVFGSLHSNSVPENITDYSFYLPDYFAHHAVAHPRALEPFQAMNLAMTRGSARNVSRKIPWNSAKDLVASIGRIGFRPSTIAAISTQLVKEVLNPRLRIRRRNLQALLSSDLFFNQLQKKKPHFSTLFTNHVAAAMHRYWGATFPQDYRPGMLEKAWVNRYSDEILIAMDCFDKILGRAMTFAKRNPDYSVVIAGSLGQAAIPAAHTKEFLTILDLPKFLNGMGLANGEFELRPAMVPCHSLVVDESARSRFIERLESLSINGKAVVKSRKPIAPLSFDEKERGFFQVFIQFDDFKGSETATVGKESIAFENLGLGMMPHEDGVNCTAQHIPEGTLLVWRPLKSTNSGGRILRDRIPIVDFAPSLLTHFGVPLPAYMKGRPSITF